jgi:tRNA threonylcarbamoyl adenosine modification protein YjeE
VEPDVIHLVLTDEVATQRLGQDIAMALRVGDVLLLKGDLGAGKSALARAIIRTLANDPDLEVPSPTFTLVQTYDTRVPVRHFDLYRLSSPDELLELGLDEALQEAAVLVEWPERAGESFPSTAITIELTQAEVVGLSNTPTPNPSPLRGGVRGGGVLAPDYRKVSIVGAGPAFDRIKRSLAIREFLVGADWGDAQRAHLTGDASARTYETASLPGAADRIIMNSPRLVLGPPVRDGKPYAVIAHTAQSVAAFVGVDRLLRSAGFAAPQIHAADIDRGFLLIEHLGEETLVDGEGRPVAERYHATAQLLADMHVGRWSHEVEVAPGQFHIVPPFDRAAMLIEAELLMAWYAPAYLERDILAAEINEFRSAWNTVLDRLEDAETTLMLRDVQSPNFIWRGERTGSDRLGVIDFQDALIGPAAYDVASLALDPRVTIEPDLEQRIIMAYVAKRRARGDFDQPAFERAYAVMGAQRHSKILGIFVRLHRRDGKPQYLPHLPRVRSYLKRLLTHPSLAEVREFYDRLKLLDGESL